jgi:hypothetical protein
MVAMKTEQFRMAPELEQQIFAMRTATLGSTEE